MSRDSPNVSSPRSTAEEITASHYALKVALQTMKERCQQLQQRLAKVEEENSLLRVEKCRKDVTGNKSLISRQDTSSLEEKIALLTRQKSQLTHHLYMVATENRHLWSRLSCLTEANQSLGNHLSKISSTLSRHNSGTNLINSSNVTSSSTASHIQIDGVSDQNITISTIEDKQGNKAQCTEKSPPVSTECNETSLDDISLKIIKSFLQEKSDLEQQYAQMVEIQTGEVTSSPLTVSSLGFSYLEEGDDEALLEELEQQCQKLHQVRDSLKEQQELLKTCVENFDKVKNGEIACAQCKIYKEQIQAQENLDHVHKWETSDPGYSEEVRRQLNQVAEPPDGKVTSPRNAQEFNYDECRLCPMCGQIFCLKEITFEKFTEHVQTHFAPEADDDEDEEPFSFLENIHVVTK